jgi:hypothetical protein
MIRRTPVKPGSRDTEVTEATEVPEEIGEERNRCSRVPVMNAACTPFPEFPPGTSVIR